MSRLTKTEETDGAAKGESSSLRLSRVVKEEDVVKMSVSAFSCVKSPNIGGDLVGVDVSFRSFLCAKEKEQLIYYGSNKNKNRRFINSGTQNL